MVTGASRGIGRGCAVELGRAGATVYVTGRTVEPRTHMPGTVGTTAAEVTEAGGHGIAVACDHRDDAAVAALFERVQAEHGRLDVLVNNAFKIPPELTSRRPFHENPISNWDDMIGVGTRSAYVASWHAVPLMATSEGASIINISSSGAQEYAWHVAYGVGKAAVMPFHRWLPAAMVAPTPVSALLHAVAVVKAGVFTVLKIAVYVFGIDLLATLTTTSWLA